MGGDGPVLAPADDLHQGYEVVGGEGELEGAHLVEDAAKGPDVALVVVRLSPADLRTEVVRSPDGRRGQVQGVSQRL